MIASHADVVGVEREKWTVDPFAGLMKDGYVWGRGAIDFKGGVEVFAEAVMRLSKELSKQELLDLEDAAVAWRTMDGKIHVHQSFSPTAAL